MNKKEVLEIRKQFTPANCAITRMCGCYVDHEKVKQFESKDAFLSLPEEETFKYFDIFRKSLSGSIGKNLLSMPFPLESEKEGGTQEFLLRLRNSKLKNDALLEEFYDKVIENYAYNENYYIILIHAMYDIPGKASDGMEMYDASDEVYEFILCSICPVSLSKAGLSYKSEENRITDRIRDWIVDKPDKAFLFPAFTDRSTDLHEIMYYTKKPTDLQELFIEEVLGTKKPLSAAEQKDAFNLLIQDTLGNDGNYEIVRNIHEQVHELIEEHKEDLNVLQLDKAEIKKIFEKSNAPADKMESFDKTYDMAIGNQTSLMASNITAERKFEIATPSVKINVDPDRTDLIETKEINGRKCLVIPVDETVEINGLTVKA